VKIALSGALFLLLAILAVLAGAQSKRKTVPGNGPSGVPQSTFFVHRLGTDYDEAITTLDMNGDGWPDLLSGAYWYENPGPDGGTWKQHQYRTVDLHNEYVSDCGEWIFDVNHDGAPDLVTAGWIVNGLWWYENPKKLGAEWQRHFITDSYDTEGGVTGDINGDGKLDLALAHYNQSGITWVDFSGPAPKVHHLGGKGQDGHGIGIADVNGDGKADILTPFGWFENIDADHDKWEWHPDWGLGDAGFPIIGYDVNGDGKMDIIYGRGHSYGLYWLEQQGSGGSRNWIRHTIDESFSQVHALALADIDGDGQPELITGKRYRAHSGGDPGTYDPLVVYYYKIDRKTGTFTRYPISVNGTAGVGTQILALDLDSDGDVDLATAGKTGVHLFENLKVDRVPKATREQQILLDKSWPFPGEGAHVEQEDGPSPK
jgi:FG-GAP-like repeat